MLELICHQTYRWGGLAADLSPYNNHGQSVDVGFLQDGTAPGSGAVRFPDAGSRIVIPVGPGWRPLGGVKVEMTARIHLYTSMHVPLTLLSADGAFTFSIFGGNLVAAFQSSDPTGNFDHISANEHGPPGSPYVVPLNQWVTLGFEHDGLNVMQLVADGKVVARRTDLRDGVPGVGPQGVCIGNLVDGPWPLQGEVDEVKIWRPDPDALRRQFLGRPYDPATADCWTRFFRSLREALQQEPDCAQQIATQIEAIFDRLCRTIASRGPKARSRFQKFTQTYAKLWCSGQIDSPKMEKLFRDWCTWTHKEQLALDDPDLQALTQSECFQKICSLCVALDCDPQITALLGFLTHHCA
jgi:hypothetical protein